MQRLTIETDSLASAKQLATFLRTVKTVQKVIIEPTKKGTETNIVEEPAEEYNWQNPSRPATEEEFEQMITEAENEIEMGLGIPSKKAYKQNKYLTKAELLKRALESEKDIKEGNFITLEQLEEEMRNW